MQIFKNNNNVPIMLSGLRTQMEAHAVLASPHVCPEIHTVVLLPGAGSRGAPVTRLHLIIWWTTARATHMTSRPSSTEVRCRLAVTIELQRLLIWVIFFSLEIVCLCVCFLPIHPLAEDPPLRCVCRSWCCESGRWHTFSNPAISQHQGGTAPLPTRRRTTTRCSRGRRCSGCKELLSETHTMMLFNTWGNYFSQLLCLFCCTDCVCSH